MTVKATSHYDYSLTEVERPGRYLGLEHNRPVLAHEGIKVCLIFPDLYDIGISYYGFQILYHILNTTPGVRCERAYLPWRDMQQRLIARREPLSSVETGTPLSTFDVLGFTMQTELHYPGVLKVLDLAGIPRYAKERTAAHPIILGGGPNAFHPEPVAPFFDAFLLGDGEEAFPEILAEIRRHLPRKQDNENLWNDLAAMQGVYVPRLYQADPEEPARIIPIGDAPARIKARTVIELKPGYYPLAPIVPVVRGEHDRLIIEIMRGCTQGCRFCQAGMINRPVRERPVDEIVQQVLRGVALTGMDEVGLLSLSTSDYSRLDELLVTLGDRLRGRNATLAFPSLRPSSFTDEIARINTGARKTSLTFAVEAGSERLRKVLNKNLSEELLFSAVERAYRRGWKTVKLYFMIGLPTETDEDIEAGAELLQKLAKMPPRGRELHLSAAPFIPKPHTIFEDEPFLSLDELLKRHRRLYHRADKPWVKRGAHDAFRSRIEALLTRGDRRLARSIEAVADTGDGFESWGGEFSYRRWVDALERHYPDWEQELQRHEAGKPHSWDHLSSGITSHFQREELSMAIRAEERTDCRLDECYHCGLSGVCNDVKKHSDPVIASEAKQSPSVLVVDRGEEAVVTVSNPEVKYRYRVYYAKLGNARMLGHHDLQRAIERGLRRAGVPLIYTEGYSPHPRLSYSPAIPLGYGAVNMWLDFESAIGLEPADWLRKLRHSFPTGVRPYAIRSDIKGEGEEPRLRTYRLMLDCELPQETADRIIRQGDSDALDTAIRVGTHRRTILCDLKPPSEGGLRPESLWREIVERLNIASVKLMHITRIN